MMIGMASARMVSSARNALQNIHKLAWCNLIKYEIGCHS